jgi:multidrug efflux pump subunit AcrB
VDSNKDNKVYKRFALSSWAVNNKMTVFVIIGIVVLLGFMSYNSMPREAFPEIVTPEIYIGTPYPGNSAIDIEKLITKPLEKEIKAISGIDDISSTSVQGYSTVDIVFDFDITPEEALRKVKDKVDLAMSSPDWPKDLPSDPNVFSLNFSELMPIMNINLSGNFSMDQLKEYGQYLEDEIEALTEINEVDVRGVMDKEIEIAVDLLKMEALELNFGDIAAAIQNENVTISAGDMRADGLRRSVRIIGEFTSPDEIGDIIIKQEKFDVVYLREIAAINFKELEKNSYAREYRNPVVMLDVKKRAGENQLDAAEKINKIIENAVETKFPSDLSISITNDTSEDTKQMVSELENSIILGMILVVVVLMFFLGFRNALFVGIAIPLSMLLSFLILNMMGVSLNTMVLFSLVMALGMLVDNGIVVVEIIFRYMSEGVSARKAAKRGAGEVAWPIIASTATTLAAFIPLGLWPGMMGEFMKYLPITLIIVLSSSLFVGLVINPMLTSVYMRVNEKASNIKRLRNVGFIMIVIGALFLYVGYSKESPGMRIVGNLIIFFGLGGYLNARILSPATRFFQQVFMTKLERLYTRTLKFTLSGYKSGLVLLGTFALLIFSFVLFSVFPPDVYFFPDNQPNLVYVYSDFPIGTDIEVTNDLTREIENKIIDKLKKYEVEELDENGVLRKFNYMVESVIAQVGDGAGDPNEGFSPANTPNKSSVTVALVNFDERRAVSSKTVMAEIREAVGRYPGVKIKVAKESNGPPVGSQISIQLQGDNYFELMEKAGEMVNFINEQNVPGVEELTLDVEQGKPEMQIEIDRKKARRYNVSTAQIGDAFRSSIYGLEVSRYKIDGDEDDYPINIRLQDKYRYSEDFMMNQKITFRDQVSGKIQQVPVSAIASSKKTTTFSSVKHYDNKRVINIQSGVLEGFNPTETNERISKVLEDFDLPGNMSIRFTGEQEEQAEQMSFLSMALAIAVLLIFLILVAQFNSAATPFIIITSILLSLTGVLLGLIAFNMEFIIMMTMIGIISLAGIVVNNAIVLIDYVNLVMDRKKMELGLHKDEYLTKQLVFESIVEGGTTRLRPVLLTAITTILGLIPLAVGININFITMLSDYKPQLFIGGDNAVFWGPMAWSIIFGLTFATFLTLVVVPIMYYFLIRLQIRMFKKKHVQVIA